VDRRTRVGLGRTGLQVTRLGLGTAPLGGLYAEVSETEAHAVVAAAFNQGLRYFDTAPLYGHGLAERRTGEVLRSKPRGDFVLSTKVGRLLRPGAPSADGQFKGTPPVVPVFDFSYDATLRSVEESLSRLGLDRIDMLLIHDPDQHYDAARSGAYPALERMRSEGVVRAIGAGMNQVELLVRFARETDVDCLLVAGRYTLLDQDALTQLLPLCLARGVAVIAGGVFNSGILARPAAGAPYNYEPAADEIVERAQRIEAVCASFDVPVKAAALQFPLGHPAVACVLTGCRSVAELDENIGLFELELPPALWTALKTQGLLRETAPMPSPGRP
jgi:D-threo-aldose 1-dehydrogenase